MLEGGVKHQIGPWEIGRDNMPIRYLTDESGEKLVAYLISFR
jgi:hypothetical protein